VTVIDGTTNATTTVPAGASPFALAVNSTTNKIYVVNQVGNSLTEIDGATNATATVAVGSSPTAVAVNPVTNTIYVANAQDGTVTVIQAPALFPTTVTVGAAPQAIAVNPLINRIYVVNTGSSNVTILDGATNQTTTLAAGSLPQWVTVNPATNAVYVANVDGNDITEFTEDQLQTIPLTTAIGALANNQSASGTPTFNFTAQSTFSPIATTPYAVYFQADSWDRTWTAAGSTGNGTFSGTQPAASALLPGGHILYAYAADGQDATQASSPLIGNIASYYFVVEATGGSIPPPPISFAPASVEFGPVYPGSRELRILTLTNTSGADLTKLHISLSKQGRRDRDEFEIENECHSPLAAGASCIIRVFLQAEKGGTQDATIKISDDAGLAEQVLLTANVIDPKADFDPDDLDFDSVRVGNSTVRRARLENSGTTPLIITGIAIAGEDAKDFTQTNDCPNVLVPGAKCFFQVSFKPSAKGWRSAQLTVTGNTRRGKHDVRLSGTGAAKSN
jgi:YVTN family beta-propeller protein